MNGSDIIYKLTYKDVVKNGKYIILYVKKTFMTGGDYNALCKIHHIETNIKYDSNKDCNLFNVGESHVFSLITSKENNIYVEKLSDEDYPEYLI